MSTWETCLEIITEQELRKYSGKPEPVETMKIVRGRRIGLSNVIVLEASMKIYGEESKDEGSLVQLCNLLTLSCLADGGAGPLCSDHPVTKFTHETSPIDSATTAQAPPV